MLIKKVTFSRLTGATDRGWEKFLHEMKEDRDSLPLRRRENSWGFIFSIIFHYWVLCISCWSTTVLSRGLTRMTACLVHCAGCYGTFPKISILLVWSFEIGDENLGSKKMKEKCGSTDYLIIAHPYALGNLII